MEGGDSEEQLSNQDCSNSLTLVDLANCPSVSSSGGQLPVRRQSTVSWGDLASFFSATPSSSSAVTPFQERRHQEKNWQTNLSEFNEVFPHDTHFNVFYFIQAFSSERTLQLLFKLFDWDCVGSVTQSKLVDCARVTLQAQGGIELVELLDVLAYVVCGEEGNITEEHFVKIFTSKGVIEKLFKYIIKDGDRCVSRQHIMDLIANLTYARPSTGFSKENLEWLEELFRKALGAKQELSFEDFKKIVHSRNSFFAGRMFEIFDRDKSGSVSLTEFLDAMHQFAGKSPNDKIKFLFRVYDLDGDGLIQREELEQVMKACMEENGMKFSDEQIEDLTLALFEDADTEQRGEITYEALKAQLEKHPGLLENLSISIDRWLVPPQPEDKRINCLEKLSKLRPYQLTLPYLKNNYVYLVFLFSYLAVNAGLFIDRTLSVHYNGHVNATVDNYTGQTTYPTPYALRNPYYVFARGGGQCLNFNCAFILVLMLRQCITFLRSRGASAFLPLDQHIYLHKLVGWFIFFFSILHTVMHLINFPLYVVTNPAINVKEYSVWQWLFTATPGAFGLIPGWANPTGFILVIILIIMVVCSLPFVRKSGYFEVFYWTHILYVAFWVLTILHGPRFWKWFVGPAVLFMIEKFYRFCRVKTGHGKTYISSGILLPSKVIHLVIHKPMEFHHRPGDYVFVNIPAIAKYEWHPLTISSAPEQEGALGLHIRAVGEWTNRLYAYFENQQLQCERKYIQKISMINMKDTKTSVELDFIHTVSSDDEDGQKNRRNGVVNSAYEKETTEAPPVVENINELKERKASKLDKKPTIFDSPRGILSKKKVEKTTSVPDLERRRKDKERKFMFNENFRNNSSNLMDQAALKKAQQMAKSEGGTPNSEIVFSTNRSVARSVRYMRHKPKVVTLDMPDEMEHSGILDDNHNNSDIESNLAGEQCELRQPQNTEVRRGSGRLFDNRFSLSRKLSKKQSRVQSTRSHEDTLKMRQKRISRLKEAESFGQCTIGKPLVIYVDGPYGAPSSHIFRAQHAVLIATGIGVTPFASILQSLMHRYLKARQECPKCTHAFTADIPQTVMHLRKVDFFWINRNQRSFEWFVNLLSQLEIEQAEQGGVMDRFLDMHMYITSALQRTDMKAVGLQLALELLHEKEKRDLITGLKTRTNAGRPNWDKVFKQLSSQKKGKITVFYCGPPALARTLRYKCDEFGFDFRKEIF